jgi:hypothetical protein
MLGEGGSISIMCFLLGSGWVGDMLESLGLLDPAVWLMLGNSSCGWFVAE